MVASARSRLALVGCLGVAFIQVAVSILMSSLIADFPVLSYVLYLVASCHSALSVQRFTIAGDVHILVAKEGAIDLLAAVRAADDRRLFSLR